MYNVFFFNGYHLQFDSTISQIAIIIDIKYVVFKIKIILLYFFVDKMLFLKIYDYICKSNIE